MPFTRREREMSPVIFVPGNHGYYHARRQHVGALPGAQKLYLHYRNANRSKYE